VLIRNDRGEEIYNQQHETNPFGTIDGALPLAEEASLGYYNLEAQLAGWPQDAYFTSPTSASASRWPSTASRSSPSTLRHEPSLRCCTAT
jgi:hypothetical protein